MLHGSVASTLSGSELSYSVQGAYAVTNHFALTGAVNGTMRSLEELAYTDNNGAIREENVQYNRRSVEFGAGVFFPISRDSSVFFETYAGYGFGFNRITELTNTTVTNFHNSNTNRFYIQPSFSYHPMDQFALSFLVRFTSIRYTDIATTYTNEQLESYRLLQISSSRLLFVEPSLIASIGFLNTPWLRIQSQINFSYLTGSPNTYYRSNNFVLGLMVDPIKAFRKK